MRRLTICLFLVLAMVLSCQKQDAVQYASLKILPQVVEPQTKAVNAAEKQN